MKLVKADEARPGQRAARDVTDLRGNLLFKAGTELTPELIATCKQRNISHVFIEDASGPTAFSPSDLLSQKEALGTDVDRMFSGVDGTPVMQALREASKRYLFSRLGK
jgi:hypothetical protein